MNIKDLLTEKFNIKNFNIFLSDLLNIDVNMPYDITFIFEENNKMDMVNRVFEYKTFTDSEDEELKIYIIETKNVFECKNQRYDLIQKILKKSYINNGLVITFNENSLPWIISYYKVNYIKKKESIEQYISKDSKYSYTINENPNEKLIKSIENLIKDEHILISSIYEIFDNDEIIDINK